MQQELLSIADAEQRRIGQDLHDDIGQELTGLAMKAETLSEIVTERQIPERALAADIVAGLDRTRGKVRALSRGMVPVEIDSNGLVDALDELTARLGDLHHITCVFRLPGSVDRDRCRTRRRSFITSPRRRSPMRSNTRRRGTSGSRSKLSIHDQARGQG